MPHEPSSSHHVSVVTADSGARRQLPALDGIRALAIIGVYIFHVWPAVLPGGFKGVDVFFVLSGFLITSIIRKNLADGVFSFREFYLRRVQRLLPNAALTVAATVLFVVVFLPSSIANQAARHGLWSLFNLSNLFAYRYLGDYWGSGAENVPLTHYWSLGVEEQFYILFPLVFFLLWKFLRRWVPLVLIAGAIVSFALCFQMTRVDKITAFYLPQYRFWELLAGAVLACGCNLFERNVGGGHKCLPCNGLRLIGLLSGFLGIILIAISFIYKVPSKTFPREIALLSVLGSVCLIYAVLARGTFFNRLLSLALFTAIGRVSYSLYLWHWPPIVFGGLVCEYYFLNNFDGALARAAGGVISILFAIAAYFLVECPLRQRGGGRAKRLFVIAGVFLFATTLCFTLGWKWRGKDNGASALFDPIEWKGRSYEIHAPFHNDLALRKMFGNGFLPRAENMMDVWTEYASGTPTFTDDGFGVLREYGAKNQLGVVLLGDSHAAMYAHVFDVLCRRRCLTGALYIRSGMGLNDGVMNSNTSKRYDALVKLIKKRNPKFVLIAVLWDREAGTLAGSMRELLKQTVGSSTVFAVLVQPPVLPVGTRVNLRSVVMRSFRETGQLPKFFPDKGEELRRAVRRELGKLADVEPRLKGHS